MIISAREWEGGVHWEVSLLRSVARLQKIRMGSEHKEARKPSPLPPFPAGGETAPPEYSVSPPMILPTRPRSS